MEVIYIVEPIISTSTNKLIAVEVLSRFYSNEGAILSTQGEPQNSEKIVR